MFITDKQSTVRRTKTTAADVNGRLNKENSATN